MGKIAKVSAQMPTPPIIAVCILFYSAFKFQCVRYMAYSRLQHLGEQEKRVIVVGASNEQNSLIHENDFAIR